MAVEAFSRLAFLGFRDLHSDLLTTDLLVIQLLDGVLGITLIGVGDETKTWRISSNPLVKFTIMEGETTCGIPAAALNINTHTMLQLLFQVPLRIWRWSTRGIRVKDETKKGDRDSPNTQVGEDQNAYLHFCELLLGDFEI